MMENGSFTPDLKSYYNISTNNHTSTSLTSQSYFNTATREGVAQQNQQTKEHQRDEEREKRAYMEDPAHGIHPLANAGGKGIHTLLREVDCKPIESVPRVL
ncbi:hypothetical protein AABB24_036510 [Solanum stoloniferum]|uniref:Uncharacterized protein n=1 Tax=Solanum stoloniferum TaxID=62892 RepID=A0ABD2RDD9_9SOLN